MHQNMHSFLILAPQIPHCYNVCLSALKDLFVKTYLNVHWIQMISSVVHLFKDSSCTFSALQILETAFSVRFGPRCLIACLTKLLLCSTSRSNAMFLPGLPLLLTVLFQTKRSASLGLTVQLKDKRTAHTRTIRTYCAYAYVDIRVCVC